MKEKKPPYRPSIYTEELAALICHRVATNPHGLKRICKMYDDMPHPDTINEWRYKYESFSVCYINARLKQSHLIFESAIDEVEELHDYTYKNLKTGAISIDPGIVAMKKTIANQKVHHAARISPKHYGVVKTEDATNPQETINKIQQIVNELNKTNSSDI